MQDNQVNFWWLNMNLTRFDFKPVTASQRTLLHAWLEQDYIQQWIHGVGLQNTLKGLETFLKRQESGKPTDSYADITNHWLGYDGDKPFVYLLTTCLAKDDHNEYTRYSETAGPFITLDIFIGDTAYLGQGLASQVIKEFLLSRFPEVREIFIDPEKSNVRAVHVYQKVGFSIVGEFIAPWHPVPHHVMKLCMNALCKKLTGRCLCEAITYEIAGELGPVVNCHCSQCRRWHGAAFRTRTSIQKSQFTWLTGELHVSSYSISKHETLQFCSICGSSLITIYPDEPDVIGLPLGGLEQDPGVRPEANIFVASKAPWYTICDNLPQYDELPNDNG